MSAFIAVDAPYSDKHCKIFFLQLVYLLETIAV